jgi:hypothetical protein
MRPAHRSAPTQMLLSRERPKRNLACNPPKRRRTLVTLAAPPHRQLKIRSEAPFTASWPPSTSCSSRRSPTTVSPWRTCCPESSQHPEGMPSDVAFDGPVTRQRLQRSSRLRPGRNAHPRRDRHRRWQGDLARRRRHSQHRAGSPGLPAARERHPHCRRLGYTRLNRLAWLTMGSQSRSFRQSEAWPACCDGLSAVPNRGRDRPGPLPRNPVILHPGNAGRPAMGDSGSRCR